MTPTNVNVAARIPIALHTDLQALAARDSVDLSTVIRHALRAYADQRLTTPAGLFDPRQGITGNASPETSRQAATLVKPRTGTQRHTILDLVARAAHGLTADQIGRILRAGNRNPPQSGVSARVNELVAAKALMPLRHYTGDPRGLTEDVLDGIVVRRTSAGAPARVLVATPLGRDWLHNT